jgi:predicted nucleic acid-binding protein
VAFPAFFDTNVLYGAYLNDFILRLADRGAFRPLWSEGVLEELDRNLRAAHDPAAMSLRIAAMRDAFPDAIVHGWESLVEAQTCDPKDRHVLAAAIRGGADILVTFNLADFPEQATSPYDIEVVHPDEFLLDQLDLSPRLVLGTVRDWSADTYRPPLSEIELLQALARSQVPRFAIEVMQRYTED